MSKQIQLSPMQREKGLIDLIEDAKKLGFNGDLIKGYEQQLNKIQEILKQDKEKKAQFKLNTIQKEVN